jgi:hypothetical protein
MRCYTDRRWNYYDVVAIVENQIDIGLRARLAGPSVAAWCALLASGKGVHSMGA